MELTRQVAISILSDFIIQDLSYSEKIELIQLWWDVDEPGDIEDYPFVSSEDQKQLRNGILPLLSEIDKYSHFFIFDVQYRFYGCKNKYIKDRLSKHNNSYRNVDIIGEPELMRACPCCDYFSIEDDDDGDWLHLPCPVCGWELGSGSALDDYSYVNHMTLNEGRKNFALYGAYKEGLTCDLEGPLKFERNMSGVWVEYARDMDGKNETGAS